MYVTSCEYIFHTLRKRCPRRLRSTIEYAFENPSDSGLILTLGAGALFVDFYCLYFILPSILKDWNSLVHWTFYIGTNMITLAVLGHLYVLVKDEAVNLSKVLHVVGKPAGQGDYGNAFQSSINQELRFRKSTLSSNESNGIHPNFDLGENFQNDECQSRLKHLGLILYLILGSLSACLVSFIHLLKTEGFQATCYLILRSIIWMSSLHFGAIMTVFLFVMFLAASFSLVIYVKVVMTRQKIDTEISLDSILTLFESVRNSQSLYEILVPDVVGAFSKSSGLLPGP